MNLSTKTTKIELLLRQRQLLSLDNAKPRVALEVRKGVLWVTASGDARDHILFSGQRYATPTRDGKVIIEALENASIDIEES